MPWSHNHLQLFLIVCVVFVYNLIHCLIGWMWILEIKGWFTAHLYIVHLVICGLWKVFSQVQVKSQFIGIKDKVQLQVFFDYVKSILNQHICDSSPHLRKKGVSISYHAKSSNTAAHINVSTFPCKIMRKLTMNFGLVYGSGSQTVWQVSRQQYSRSVLCIAFWKVTSKYRTKILDHLGSMKGGQIQSFHPAPSSISVPKFSHEHVFFNGPGVLVFKKLAKDMWKYCNVKNHSKEIQDL